MKVDKYRSNTHFKRLYRGSFQYFHEGHIYSQESFEVYRDKKEMNLHYDAEIISRVSTGEVLKIYVNYIVNKEWTPLSVTIEKALGQNLIEETYTFTQRTNQLRYRFKSDHDRKEELLNTPPKFHIMTPAACTAFLFINSKKIDQTTKNYFHIYRSYNAWIYQHEIGSYYIALTRAILGEVENIKIQDKNLQAIQYRVCEDERSEAPIGKSTPEKKNSKQRDQKQITVFMSKHVATPYKIIQNESNWIDIQYLNDFSEDSTDNEIF